MKKQNYTALFLLFLMVIGCKFSTQAERGSAPPAASNRAANSNEGRTISFAVNDNSITLAEQPAKSSAPAIEKSGNSGLQAVNAVCPDPAKPCQHREKQFDEWELSFKMPARLQPNKIYKSAPFYAVILETYEMTDEICDGGEYSETLEVTRKKLQAASPQRKVFAEYQCPNMAAVGYDFTGKWDAAKEYMLIGNYLAIYAGTTEAEAQSILNEMKADHPKAMLKRMTESYEKTEQ